jgi:drug/metabolite transporter (DMT)-like permease
VPDERDPDLALWGAAVGFACATAFTTAVAIRDDLPGRPLGIQVPLSVPTGILVGWGAAVAAPWPMPVAAVIAAARANAPEAGSGPALVCAGLGMAGIVGLLIEPNTYNRQAWTPANRVAVTTGLVACAFLAVAGLRHWRQAHKLASGPEVVQE